MKLSNICSEIAKNHFKIGDFVRYIGDQGLGRDWLIQDCLYKIIGFNKGKHSGDWYFKLDCPHKNSKIAFESHLFLKNSNN